MKKKLLAIVMSASMVLSFMPSIAFAGTATYSVENIDCWSYVPGSSTAKLVKVIKTEDGKDTTISYDADATVEYYKDSTKLKACGGDTKTVDKIVFKTTKKVLNDNYATYAYELNKASEITFPDHKFVTVAAVAPTCTKGGNYEYKKCSVCGDVVGYDKDGNEFTTEVSAKLPAKNHNVTLAPTSKYWRVNGNKVGLSVLATLKCDDCGQTFTINHDKDAQLNTLYDSEETIDSKTTEKSKDCTAAGLITVNKATVLVEKDDALAGDSRANADINVKYVSKDAAAANAKHTFNGASKFVWNKDFTKCVYKVNPCTTDGCEVAEKTIDCTVTRTSKATCKNAARPEIKATCTVTPEEGPISEVASGADFEKAVKVEPKLAHNYKFVEAQAPTCTKAGYKAHYECTNGCNDWFEKTTDGRYIKVDKSEYELARTHTLSGDYTLPTKKELAEDFFADGDLDSKTATVKNAVCSKCGQAIDGVSNAALSVDGKAYNKLNEGKNACVDSIVLPVVLTAKVGMVEYKDTVNVTLDPRGHNGVVNTSPKFIWNTEDPGNATCQIAFKSCDRHNWTFKGTNFETPAQVEKTDGVATVSQPATVEKTVTTEPTCKKVGEATYKATYKHSQTGQIYTETKKVVLPKIDHKATVIEAVAPTVFTEGKTAGVKCAICGEILEAPKTVEKAKYAAPTVKAGKKLATVTVKSTKGAVKYQISYKKVGGKYVTKTVKAGKKVTIKKLAKGKKYTFKAVAINADGVKATSAVKTVKIK